MSHSAAVGCVVPARPCPGRGWLLVMVAIVATAAASRIVLPTNNDVSWLIDAAGRVLSGQHLYVDVMEVNPPASVALYMPPVAVASWLDLRPEVVTDVMMVMGAWASVTLTGRIARGTGLFSRAVAPWRAAALACLLLLPGFVFAEREHIAVMALLPGLAALAARHAGSAPTRTQAMLAGVGIGLVMMIKPMFALGLVGPVAFLGARDWRKLPAAAELWLGAALAALYGWAVWRHVPAFTERMLPLAMAVYVPRRLPLVDLVLTLPTLLWVLSLTVLALCARKGPVGALAAMLGAASVGFEIVVVQQGKGFPYHGYPATCCAVLALATGLLHNRAWRMSTPFEQDRRAPFPWRLGGVFAAALALAALSNFNTRFDPFTYAPGLDQAVESLGPHPRLLAISPHFDFGQPFARRIGARWAGSAPSAWVTANAAALVAQGAAAAPLQPYVEAEKRMYAADITRKRPDAVLVDGPEWQAWIDGSPTLTAAMAAYHPGGSPFGPVVMWVRNDAAQTRP